MDYLPFAKNTSRFSTSTTPLLSHVHCTLNLFTCNTDACSIFSKTNSGYSVHGLYSENNDIEIQMAVFEFKTFKYSSMPNGSVVFPSGQRSFNPTQAETQHGHIYLNHRSCYDPQNHSLAQVQTQSTAQLLCILPPVTAYSAENTGVCRN